MEVYILDDSLRRVQIVEKFQSMIWTERYSESGDFELHIDPLLAESDLFLEGTRLTTATSDRVMVIDSVENDKNDDGIRLLKITGKSLENIMNDRPNQSAFVVDGSTATQQTFTGLPAEIIRNLFDAICRINTDVPSDNLPFLQEGQYSEGTPIPEPADEITTQTDIDTLYNTIKQIADTYLLGFRIIRVEDEDPTSPAKLYFEVYTGFDRTTGQTTYAPMVFSSELDNLTDTSELISTAAVKNTAYVISPNGSRVVYADYVDPDLTGFDKRILIVNASDIDLEAGVILNDTLDQRGKEELSKTRPVIGFDGQIPQKEGYIYNVDYALGDIVEQKSLSGTVSKMRITEHISVSDVDGEKSYPTLLLDTLIEPGTWAAVPATKVWYDYTDEVWATV